MSRVFDDSTVRTITIYNSFVRVREHYRVLKNPPLKFKTHFTDKSIKFRECLICNTLSTLETEEDYIIADYCSPDPKHDFGISYECLKSYVCSEICLNLWIFNQ